MEIQCSKAEIKASVYEFLKKFQTQITDIVREPFPLLRMCGDFPAYDWVLFCDLFGGPHKIPDFLYLVTFDLASIFFKAGIDPDIDRVKFSGLPREGAHNALYDAKVIKACYEKIL